MTQLKKQHSHTLKLSGFHLDTSSPVLINAMIGFDTNYGCVLKCHVLARETGILSGLLESLCK